MQKKVEELLSIPRKLSNPLHFWQTDDAQNLWPKCNTFLILRTKNKKMYAFKCWKTKFDLCAKQKEIGGCWSVVLFANDIFGFEFRFAVILLILQKNFHHWQFTFSCSSSPLSVSRCLLPPTIRNHRANVCKIQTKTSPRNSFRSGSPFQAGFFYVC